MGPRIVIVLAILSFCTARSVRNDKITVDVTKQGIEISYSKLRKEVDITFKENVGGQDYIELKVKTRGAGTTRYQIGDYQVNNNGDLQSEILNEVFESYKGDLDQDKYEDLLGDIEERVSDGEVNTAIYQALAHLIHRNSNQVGATSTWPYGVTYPSYPYMQGGVYPYGVPVQVDPLGPYTYGNGVQVDPMGPYTYGNGVQVDPVGPYTYGNGVQVQVDPVSSFQTPY